MESPSLTQENASQSRLSEKQACLPGGFRSLVRRASLLRFRQHCCSDAIEAVEVDDSQKLVFAHWMGLILIASSSVRLLFKAHYNSRDITSFAKDVIGAEAPQSAIADFVREYCNLMGGVIKGVIENSGVSIGLSLPLVTRGFDQVFADRKSAASGTFHDSWCLKSDSAEIILSLQMDILSSDALDKISVIEEETEVEEEGGVEFL